MKKYIVFLLFILSTNNLYAQKCNAVSISFESNKYALTKADITEIKRILSTVEPFKIQSISIEGRTDSTGTIKANSILSQKRIEATIRALKPLLNKDVSIETNNYGESNPISFFELSQNRSVKIIFNLDTLVNLAKKGEGEIWLNTKTLDYIGSCNFTISVTSRIGNEYESIYYTTIPKSKKPRIYNVRTLNNCLDVYIFPDSFYNPVTHIGRFDTLTQLWYYRKSVDSINFSNIAEQIQYDSISRSYYLIENCNNHGGNPCGGVRYDCTSLIFVPERTIAHITRLTYIKVFNKPLDTLIVSNNRMWEDWGCIDAQYLPYVYSIAMFDSSYYYLKGDLYQYKRTDTTAFEFDEKKYKSSEHSNIHQLERADYTSFSASTNMRLFVKAPRGFIPGYYIKEYDVLIPFDQTRKRKHKAYVIDFPTEFGLQQGNVIITGKDLIIKTKVRKKATYVKIKFTSTKYSEQ